MKNTCSLNLSSQCKEKIDSTSTASNAFSHSETESNDDLTEPVWKCRYVVTITGFLVLISTSIHRILMSSVIVSMVNNTAIVTNSKLKSESCPELLANSSGSNIVHNSKSNGDFLWSPEIQGYVLGGFYIGHLIGQIPSGRLGEKYGCKNLLFLSLLISSILTMMIPPFSWLSPFAIIVLNSLRGLAQSTTGPCLAILASNWYPKTERGFFVSLVHSAHSLGPFLGNIFAGYVCESSIFGWPYVFYIVGALVILLAIYILFFLAESPKEHLTISKAELNFILSHQENKLSRRRPKLPWRQLLTSVPFYALLFASIGRYASLSQFWVVHSTFLGTILHYPIGQNGLLSSIPFLLSFVITQIASWISLYIEKKKIFSVDHLRKFWIFSFSLGYSLCLFGIYISGCNRSLSVTFGVLSMGLTGLGTPGTIVVPQDMSPTFSGTLTSIFNTVGFSACVFIPLIVGYLTDEAQTLEQWNKVFFISIGIVMSSAIIFVFFGSAKIQPWNFVEEENKKKDEKQQVCAKDDEMTKF